MKKKREEGEESGEQGRRAVFIGFLFMLVLGGRADGRLNELIKNREKRMMNGSYIATVGHGR